MIINLFYIMFLLVYASLIFIYVIVHEIDIYIYIGRIGRISHIYIYIW